MADIEKTIKALKDWKNDPLALNAEIDPCLVDDAMSVIEQMEQEIERLKENIDTLLPVLHGEWEEKEYSIGKCYAVCSLCKKSSMGYAKDTGFGFEYSFPNYCPHCGAKMKDGDGE